MTTAQKPGVQLVGEPVTVSYVADPSVGHGQFRLENRGHSAVVAVVDSAWLELGGQRKPLANISLFDLDRERAINAERFKVDAEAAVRFLVGFSKVSHEPRFGESGAVGLQVSIDGSDLQARSPIKFVRRIPYDP